MRNEASVVKVGWGKLHRLIATQFPPIGLFEEVADAADLDIVFEIEAMTNDRIRQEVGDLDSVPAEDRVSGEGSTPVMAAFTHIGHPSRFTDGSYGVYYGAKTLKTAIKETVYHREVFLRATNEPDTEITMRCYVNQVAKVLHDIRAETFESLHQAEYAIPQSYAKTLRKSGSFGLVYNSVRDTGGECVAAFKPISVTIPVQAGHYKYVWRHKANKIVDVLLVSKVEF